MSSALMLHIVSGNKTYEILTPYKKKTGHSKYKLLIIHIFLNMQLIFIIKSFENSCIPGSPSL